MATRSTVKSFSSAKKEKAEPIQFSLEGVDFEAYGQIPGAVLLDFIAASSQEDSTGTAGAIMQYLKSSMDKDNFKRFDKLVRDPDVVIELQVLADIVSFLVEARTANRPTE